MACRPWYCWCSADDARILASGADITVDLAQCDATPFYGDSAALRQVRLNLWDNAVKHNSRGGWIRAELRAASGEVAFQIENSGRPIAGDLAPRLFQRFARGSGAASGSGLGLSLAKTIVEAHGGTISFDDSTLGVVRFISRLPLPSAPRRASARS